MIARLEHKRVDDAVWESPFEEAKDIANTHDIDPSFPRSASRHNSTVRMFLTSDYWRRVLYYVFLDELRQRRIVLEPRFLANFLLPFKITRYPLEEDKLAEIFNAYKTDISGDFDFFKTEVNRWILRWSLANQTPSVI